MKRFFFLTLLLMAGIGGFSQSVKKVKIDQLTEYIQQRDHPVVISFWATWCAPCVQEIPWLQKGVEEFNTDKVELILVSLDFEKEFPKGIEAFIKKKNFKASFFWLDESNADYFCPKIDSSWSGGIPSTLFLNNATGYRRFFERQLTDRQIVPEIRLLVAPAKPGSN